MLLIPNTYVCFTGVSSKWGNIIVTNNKAAEEASYLCTVLFRRQLQSVRLAEAHLFHLECWFTDGETQAGCKLPI